MFFVDSHCHLNIPKFAAKKDEKESEEEFLEKYSVDAIIQRAHKAGVKYMLAIGTELTDVDEIRNIADSHEHIFRSVGIHPQEAQKHCSNYTHDKIAKIIKEHSALPKTVAIGEIGLDYHHFERESEPQQKELFHLQMNLAKECGLPVVIHSRDAANDTVDVLNEHAGARGVIHCFSGELDFAKKSLDLGFYISISGVVTFKNANELRIKSKMQRALEGVVTFKNANELRESIKFVPLDRLLIETDSPFFAPAPFRGKINEPAFVTYVAKTVAEVKGVDVETIAEVTSNNFFRLFDKAVA